MALERGPRLRGVPLELHRLEPLECLRDQSLVLAHDPECAQGERLEIRVPPPRETSKPHPTAPAPHRQFLSPSRQNATALLHLPDLRTLVRLLGDRAHVLL